jgi:hypothetical protein
MVTTKERTDMRKELVARGYAWEYVDEWQPKVTLYRHADMIGADGTLVKPAGTAVERLPGNPDYAIRKAKLGMLPFPPGKKCNCKWCSDINPGIDSEVKEPEITQPSEDNSATCPDCGIVISAKSGANAISRLRSHVKTLHSK